VIVESDRPGTLEVCMSEITDGPQTSSRRAARNGGPQIFPVMDGQRYSDRRRVLERMEERSAHSPKPEGVFL